MKKTSCILIFLVVFVIGYIAAQDTLQTGMIGGIVQDEEGSPLPGVNVTIRSGALIKGMMSTVTAAAGNYRFIYLPVGKYEITFKLPGFKTLMKTDVLVSLRKTTTVNVTLEMSALEETVTVTGEAPVVDTKSSTIGTNFTIEMLQKIPSARDPWVLMEMTPGMVMSDQNVGGSRSGQQTSGYAYGSQRGQTSYNIDGLNMTDAAANGASAMYYDFDSFEEIQIETGAHSADIQTGGVVLNMITKSGGNKFSGGISLYGENDTLQSKNIPDTPQYESVGSGNPLDYFYEYGGELGGPILKDKFWFYGGFRSTVINRFIIGYEVNGVPQTEYTNLTHGTFKLTWQPSNSHKLQGWFNYDNKYMPHRGAGPRRPPETTAYQNSPSYFYHLEDTWTLNPNLLLNFKVGFNNMWYQTAPQKSVDMNKPAVLIYYSEPYRRMYEDAYYTYSWYYSDRYQLTASADYFKDDLLGGNHELKVGFEYNNTPFHTDRKFPGNITLYFDYPDRTGPYRVWTFRQIKWDETNEVYSAYVQDVFTLKKHLTINVGLRFDSTHMHVNESDVPGNQWTEYYTQKTGNPVALHAPARKNVVEWNTLSPRLGFTYDLFNNGNSIFKVSLARYSYQVSYEPVWRIIETGTWEVDYSWNDANKDKLPQTNEFGKIRFTDIAELVKINPKLKSPYTNEVVMGFEQRLTNDFGAGVNFIYREDRRTMWTDNLAIDSQRDYTPVTVQDPGPDGEYGTADDGGNITVYNLAEDKVGLSDPYVTERKGYLSYYKGIEFRATKRYANKWQLMGSLTLGSDKVKLPIEASDDPNNREFNDNVPAWNSVPVILKISGSYELPFGITVGAFLNYRSGYVTQRYFSYSDLNQGRINVETQKYGSQRFPNLFIMDCRLSKSFSLGKIGTIEAIVDAFNVFNSVTTLDWDAESWSGYHDIWQVLGPRILRIGFKWTF
jgi:hypothetical protein